MYHLHCSVIRRRQDRDISVVAGSAYRRGENLYDELRSSHINYSHRVDVDYKFIMAPGGSPSWALDPERLWNSVERRERRVDSQLCREFNVAFPRVFSLDTAVFVASKFVKKCFVDRGMIADVAIHGMNGNNPHFHVMLTTRKIGLDGVFSKKERSWNDRTFIKNCRNTWEHVCNFELELMGMPELKISAKSYIGRGIDKPRQRHVGPKDIRLWREEEIITARSAQYVKDQLEKELLEFEARIAFLVASRRRRLMRKSNLMQQIMGKSVNFAEVVSDPSKLLKVTKFTIGADGEVSSHPCEGQYVVLDVRSNSEKNVKVRINKSALSEMDKKLDVENPGKNQGFSPGF